RVFLLILTSSSRKMTKPSLTCEWSTQLRALLFPAIGRLKYRIGSAPENVSQTPFAPASEPFSTTITCCKEAGNCASQTLASVRRSISLRPFVAIKTLHDIGIKRYQAE